jgi:hypothetical protein
MQPNPRAAGWVGSHARASSRAKCSNDRGSWARLKRHRVKAPAASGASTRRGGTSTNFKIVGSHRGRNLRSLCRTEPAIVERAVLQNESVRLVSVEQGLF